MKFQHVVGHTEKKKTFIQSVRNGRIPHAQLFIGNAGWGSLPLALAYAQFVSCTDPNDDDSCGQCASCRKYETLTHPDLHFTFPFPKERGETCSEMMSSWREALLKNPYLNLSDWMLHLGSEKKQANIPTAEIRAILKNLSLKPYESAFKVMVIWLPEYLGKEGNILLKAIEEPTHNTLFLLVSENAEKILGTIISRTQPVRIAPIANIELERYLMQIPDINQDKAHRIAQISQGDLRSALISMNEMESPYFEIFKYWMGICYKRQMAGVVPWSEKVGAMSKESLKGFMLYGLELFRGILVANHDSSLNTWQGSEQDFIAKFYQLKIPVSNLEKMILAVENALSQIERNVRPSLVLTDLSYIVARNLKV